MVMVAMVGDRARPAVPPGPARPSATGAAPAGTVPGMDPHHCARPACAEPACAEMTYDYARRVVWLDALGTEDAGGVLWGLCAGHAANLRVPRGWAMEDRRRPPVALHQRIAV